MLLFRHAGWAKDYPEDQWASVNFVYP